MPPLLSIIIPTHNRPAILRRTLEHVRQQTIAEQLEVIVVHDVEEDMETKNVVRQAPVFAKATPGKHHDVVYLSIPRCHQATARNRGVARATAPLTLFIGDDIFLEPNACKIHVAAHAKIKEHCQFSIFNFPFAAVLGFTTWDPALQITPVMRWLEQSGWQFGYPMINRFAHDCIPHDLQHRFTYTSHISLPTEIARQCPFREDLTLYGWEDILWGTELRERGVGLFYEPDAKALHHHPLTLEQSLTRMETLGRSAVEMRRLDAELDRVPRGWKLFAYHLLATLPTLRGRHARAFLRGIRSASSL